LVTGAFTATRTASLEPFIRKSARSLVGAMSPAGRGDVIAQLAAPLPVTVISHILGIPAEQRDEFRHLSDQFMESQLTSDVAVLNASKAAIYAVFTKEIDARRRGLGPTGASAPALPDDMLSSLVVAEHDGRRFSVEELLPLLLLLLVGGIETTTSLIGSLVRRLLEGDLWSQALGDEARLLVAIEESLRFDPPVLGLFRTARAPLELHGVDLPAGAKVMGVFAAANRDPTVFSDADTFRLDRSRDELRRHLSFGAGIWLCPGAALARLEAQVAVETMAELLPGLRLDGEARQESRFLTWGPQHLPVAWQARRGEQRSPQ
jgi:cytochrome P450